MVSMPGVDGQAHLETCGSCLTPTWPSAGREDPRSPLRGPYPQAGQPAEHQLLTGCSKGDPRPALPAAPALPHPALQGDGKMGGLGRWGYGPLLSLRAAPRATLHPEDASGQMQPPACPLCHPHPGPQC